MAKQTSAAAAVVAIRDNAPDFSQAVDLLYWALPVGEFFGNKINRLITAGGTYEDGMISGRCDSIKLLPGGVVVFTVQQGWQPGKLEAEQEMRKRYVVCIGSCHGVTP